jgi:hypothetical protein
LILNSNILEIKKQRQQYLTELGIKEKDRIKRPVSKSVYLAFAHWDMKSKGERANVNFITFASSIASDYRNDLSQDDREFFEGLYEEDLQKHEDFEEGRFLGRFIYKHCNFSVQSLC